MGREGIAYENHRSQGLAYVHAPGAHTNWLFCRIETVEGHCTPPDGPGWGVELREDVLAQYPPVPFTPVESEPYREF
jgi:L-alanine-DL-glutamate epimerase-like enolase superfamily enzyme